MSLPHEEELLRSCLLGVNIVSVVVGFVLLVTYAKFKRGFPHTGVLCFSLSAWLLSASLLIGPIAGYERLADQGSAICLAQGFLIQLFGFTAVSYYFCIVLLVFIVVATKDLAGEERLTRVFFLGQHLSPLIGLITAITILALGKVEYRTLWCWVGSHPYYLEIAFFYGPMGVFSAFALVLWITMLWMIRKDVHSYSTLYRHLVMAFVFLSLFLVMFAHRLYNILSNGQDLFVLEMLHVTALGGVCIWLFIIFGLSKHNLGLWRVACCQRYKRKYVEYDEIN